MTLVVTGVTVVRGTTVACDHVDLVVGEGEVVALLGPSGSGKTSLLRAIAGLETPVHGSVSFRGRDLATVPVHSRGFGVVFQDLALFEHLDVGGNVGYAARVRRVARGDRSAAVETSLAQVGLAGFGSRRVSALSGGERQRVALARVLAAEPQLLLLDEPLGALDRRLREQLVERLREVLRASAVPTLVVTHDHDEAFALADRVVILRDGRVVQSGTVVDVWRMPGDECVSEFVGNPAAVEVERRESRLITPFGAVPGTFPEATCRAAFPARALALDAGGGWAMVVEHVRPTRTGWALEGVTPGESDPRHPRLAIHSDDPVPIGEAVRITVRAERILCFDAAGRRVAPHPA